MKHEKLHGKVMMLNLLTYDITKAGRYLRNKTINATNEYS